MATKFDSKSVIANLRASRNSSLVSKPKTGDFGVEPVLNLQKRDNNNDNHCRRSLEVLNGLVEESQAIQLEKEARKRAMNMEPHRTTSSKTTTNEKSNNDGESPHTSSVGEVGVTRENTFGDDELEFYRNLIVNDDGKHDGRPKLDKKAPKQKQARKKTKNAKERNRRKDASHDDSDSSWSDFDEEAENKKYNTEITPPLSLKSNTTSHDAQKKTPAGDDDFEGELKRMIEEEKIYLNDSAPPSDDSFSDGNNSDDSSNEINLGIDLKDFDNYDDLMDSGGGYLSENSNDGGGKIKNGDAAHKGHRTKQGRVENVSAKETDDGNVEDEDEWVIREFERRLKVAKELNDTLEGDDGGDEISAQQENKSQRARNNSQRDSPANRQLVSKRAENSTKRAQETKSRNKDDGKISKNNFSRTAPLVSNGNFQVDLKPGQRMKIHRRGSASSARSGVSKKAASDMPKWL